MKRIRLSRKAQGLGFTAYSMSSQETVRIETSNSIIDIETRRVMDGSSDPIISVKAKGDRLIELWNPSRQEGRVLVIAK